MVQTHKLKTFSLKLKKKPKNSKSKKNLREQLLHLSDRCTIHGLNEWSKSLLKKITLTKQHKQSFIRMPLSGIYLQPHRFSLHHRHHIITFIWFDAMKIN